MVGFNWERKWKEGRSMSDYPKQYPTVYRDKFGEEKTVINNDGKTLTMTLRGVRFSTWDILNFGIEDDVPPDQLNSFSFCRDGLCDYSLEYNVPVQAVVGERILDTELCLHIESGEASKSEKIYLKGQPDPLILILKITIDGQVYSSLGKNQRYDFDTQLADLQKIFPEDIYLKTCWYCNYSTYSPSGPNAFGCLMCYRDTKAEFEAVNTKAEMFALEKRRTEVVQEIHLCPEFKKLIPGLGFHYKG
jgi:hypothetical protein